MKKTTIALGTAILAFASVATAGHKKVFGDGVLPDFLSAYDVDGDGSLNEEEKQALKAARAEARAAKRAALDTDGDGVISAEEKAAARAAMTEKIEAKRAERFAEADTDADGALSTDEFNAIASVARLAARHPDKPAVIFANLDADESGGVSADEFTTKVRGLRGRKHGRGRGGDRTDDAAGGGENGAAAPGDAEENADDAGR